MTYLPAPKCYWSWLRTIQNRKMYQAYLLFFITASMFLTLKKRVKLLVLFSSITNNSTLPSDFKLLMEDIWTSWDFSETNILQIISKIRIRIMVTIWSAFVCQNYGIDLGIYLDISKDFKLRQNGINRYIINILWDFLRKKKQRVVLNG